MIKLVVGFAILGFVVIEAGSPLIARAQADDAATQIATETSFRLRDEFTQRALDESCATEAAKHEVDLVECDFDRSTDEVVVTVQKNARSIVLEKWSATTDWYHPRATARAQRK